MNTGPKIAVGVVTLTLMGVSSLAVVAANSQPSASPVAAQAATSTSTPTLTDVPFEDGSKWQDATGHWLQTIEGQTFSAEGPGDCSTNAGIFPYGTGDPNARLLGELTDNGPTEYARGPVGYNAGGQIATYTVQPGDAMLAIGERFCIDSVTVEVYNGRFAPHKTIQPGDVLVLRP